MRYSNWPFRWRSPRPVSIRFDWFRENKSDLICTFDSNAFVEWETIKSGTLGEIVFKGLPFTETGLTELGRINFDYTGFDEYAYRQLIEAMEEAKKPAWLNYAHAEETGAEWMNDEYFTLYLVPTIDSLGNKSFKEEVRTQKADGEIGQYSDGILVAFAPKSHDYFYRFIEVDIYKSHSEEIIQKAINYIHPPEVPMLEIVHPKVSLRKNK